MRTYIRALEAEKEKAKRQTICRKMFRFIAKEETKNYIKKLEHGDRLFNNIRKKLIEFYHSCEVREASVWYRDVFGQRIPPIEETKWATSLYPETVS